MSTGLIALLDDLVALTKVAAASLDDAGAQAAKATSKAAGIVIDDAAVTPRYVVGLAADRELPIIRKIAMGSLKNKLLILLPGALILSFFAPWVITPLLMAGGAFLCLEGYHKVKDLIQPGHHSEAADGSQAHQTAQQLEDERVGSAIQTDLILSAEIMAITLASVAASPLWMQAGVLAVVGVGMTLLVYGAVAVIVKADDAGVALAKSTNAAISVFGRGVVAGMPPFLKTLSFVGMIAMLWVGGSILIHGLHELGMHEPEEAVHHAAELVSGKVPLLQGPLNGLITTGIAAVWGLLVGGIVNAFVHRLIGPAIKRTKKLFRSSASKPG